MIINESIAKRFYAKVERNENGCWEWVGATAQGYGRLKTGIHKNESAHRLSYEMHIGNVPERADVCHRCDNPLCVRPSHLFTGTRQQNMQDCIRKGRRPKRRPSKLDRYGFDEIVKTVIEIGYRKAAKKFGCRPHTLEWYIKKRQAPVENWNIAST